MTVKYDKTQEQNHEDGCIPSDDLHGGSEVKEYGTAGNDNKAEATPWNGQ